MNKAVVTTCILSAALLVGVSLLLHAEAVPNQVRIGMLTPVAGTSPEEGLREGLKASGYIEGQNLTIERRRGDTDEALRSGALAHVEAKVDVIVAFGTPMARAALSATSSVPIVFISGDPVGMGLAASLAHPGGNATGVSTLSIELIPKRLELLREVAPRVRRVFLLGNPNGPLYAQVLKQAQKGASVLHMEIIPLDARNVDELEAALRRIQRGGADGFTTSPEVLFLSNKSKIAKAIAKARLPAVFPWPDYHDAGVLMAYGARTKEMGLRAAIYVDRILKGAKPADLPVEQISKYELVIDLRAARDLGITIPQSILLQADDVIR